ncbi:gastrula zinc finger protein XlCGF58.1-like [Diabrotica virgifera virgifera]|uniref:C2H2-type domain-containing protein n=2 Tax=Diabrotica virgifera virgifera TaxID=50390 RepID=A0ABM5JZT3_DIAVI|nr:gastrula zinc finger protein XlCGF58.1-like [Diabrotica virgifera virgifera]
MVHMQCVTGVPYMCFKCGKSYKVKRSLNRHLKVECGKAKTMICRYCNQSYYYKQELQCHMFNKHKLLNFIILKLCLILGNVFRCKKCPRIYRYATSLYNHVRYECGKEPKFICSFCPYKAKRKHCLKDHLKAIHQVDPTIYLQPLDG